MSIEEQHVAIIGYGALARNLIAAVREFRGLTIGHVLVHPERVATIRNLLPANIQVVGSVAEIDHELDLLVELAGHAAVATHVPEALDRGMDVALASTGALADDTLRRKLSACARRGGARLHLLSGAVGAMDALAAHREVGLDDVLYIGRKPPNAWQGTPAADRITLDEIVSPIAVFEGNARDAARCYPKNANVAATIALAGLGFERTRVRLVADPAISDNIHRIEASSAAGRLTVELASRPLPSNPRSSALAAASGIRMLHNLIRPIVL
ncbi:MAG: aspartate dehydrogenase [Stellaceae bacterium]